MTRPAAGSPFCEGRVTLLANPTFLLTNTLTRPAGSTQSRRDNQSMREHCWLRQRGQLFFFPLTQLEGEPLFRNNFSSYERDLKRWDKTTVYGDWFESIKQLALVSAVKEYLSLVLYCLPIRYAQTTLAYSFLPNPFIASNHPCSKKKTLKKASLMLVKLKQKSNSGIKHYSRMRNPDSCASLYSLL